MRRLLIRCGAMGIAATLSIAAFALDADTIKRLSQSAFSLLSRCHMRVQMRTQANFTRPA